MLHYILQTIAFQLFFLIGYDAFLKKETFFNWNRAYLLSTALASIILPFIKIGAFKTVISNQFITTLPGVFLGRNPNTKPEVMLQFVDEVVDKTMFVITWQLFLYIGIVAAALIFSYKLIKLLQLVNKNPKRWRGNLLIINLINSSLAFSFFHYIFLGEQIKPEDKTAVLKHEIIHVKEKHTFDLLFFELLRILFWFNPLIYIYQKRMVTLHEFIADDKAITIIGKKAYYENLLSQVFETKNLSFVNTFFKQSLIKKRIVMLSKSKSNQTLKFKYALLIPLVLGMLLYTSCERDSINEIETNSSVLSKIEELKNAIEIKEGQMTSEELKELTNLLVNSTRDHIIKDHLEDPANLEIIEVIHDNEKISREISFATIDEVPTYPNCEGLSNKEKKACFSKRISEYVVKNFNIELAKSLGVSGKQKINVLFKIDTNGNIVGVKSRAAHPTLEAEALRVIQSLPKMKPGKHKGKPVTVPYALPIIFQVSE